MKISYAVSVCNEAAELHRLLTILLENKQEGDEVVVQCDNGNTTQEVYQVLQEFSSVYSTGLKVIEYPLNYDFATFKNNIADYCNGEYIFQIDADEYITEKFMEWLPEVLRENSHVDLFWVARINTVEGITPEHIQKWGWRVNESGWVNFPDYQSRIYRNKRTINWVNKVHEKINGHATEGHLPQSEFMCLQHPKTIDRQEKQNEFYSKL
jgi:glycosyltransferase involved in cell wall biosynthesis